MLFYSGWRRECFAPKSNKAIFDRWLWVQRRYFLTGIFDKTFIEFLVEGAIDLYRDDESFYIEKDGEFYEILAGGRREIVRDGKRYSMTETRWKGKLKALMAECDDEIFNLIDSYRKPTLKMMIEIVSAYNICRSKDQ